MYSVDSDDRRFDVVSVEADKALNRSRRSCLEDIPAVNIAEGCGFGCLFCRTKARTGPMRIKTNLPQLLEKELEKRKRKDGLPRMVLFNSSTDSFQPSEGLLEICHDSMQIVLSRGVDVHFFTRGCVPSSFSELFKRYHDKLHAQVSFLTMDENLSRIYEPSAAQPRERLETIRNMVAWGVEVRGRLDPLIPFLSDTVGHMEELLRYLRSTGVMRCQATYLVLSPQILERFEKALPESHFHLIKGSFKGQAWRKVGIHQMTKLLPERTRSKGYERLRNVAKPLDVEIDICACDDPTHGSSCFSMPSENTRHHNDPDGQLKLFGS